MDDLILISCSKNELKQFIQNSVREILGDAVKPPNTASQYLDVDEAATFLKISKASLYQKTFNHDVPFMKRGKRLYFDRSELEKWLIGGRQPTRAEVLATPTEFPTPRKKAR